MTTTTRTEQGRAGAPGRFRRIASWIRWHLAELAGVLGPAVLAVLVTPWLVLVSGAVAVVWTVHEVRQVRAVVPVLHGSSPGSSPRVGGGRDTPARAVIEPGTGADIGTDPTR